MKTLTIIDTYGFLFRSYYALPPLTTSEGLDVGGLYGFINILIKCLKKISTEEDPYVVAAFDSGRDTFRHKLYPEYKANRPELAESLNKQFPLIREATTAFGVTREEISGLEADDVIATLVAKLKKTENLIITVVTCDKDLLQLLSDNVRIFDPVKNIYCNNEYSVSKFGVEPDKICELLSLAGDQSDNIPGVKGIGPKTAAKLLDRFGSIDGILENVEEITQAKIREEIKLQSENIKIFKQLVSLVDNAPVNAEIARYKFLTPNIPALENFLIKYEFTSTIKKALNLFHLDETQSNETKKPAISDKSNEELCKQIRLSGIFAFVESKKGFVSVSYSENRSMIVTEEQFKKLLPLIKDPGIKKIVPGECTLTTDLQDVENLFVKAYSIRSQKIDYSFKYLCSTFLNYIPENQEASALIKIYREMQNIIASERLFEIYELIDKPISLLLPKMEHTKIPVDASSLEKSAEEYAKKLVELEREIYASVGYEFNIASPEQVSSALECYIDTGAKKTKSGFFSTNASMLETLELKGVVTARKILDWRHFAKLINTYALPLASIAKKGFITTHYSMFTSTGRLSSSNYNIQNLPIKTPDGKNIRKAFIADKGKVLISADYSQIELRIIAHIAKIQGFKDAFMHGRDIHYDTAAALFEIPENLNEIEYIRRKAKAINFGILYGVSYFGLAKQLSITVKEAKIYMDNYFCLYPEISKYMSETINFCRENNFVTTIFGRKCLIKDIHSKDGMARKHAERQAVNAPIQGSAADMLKLVLIKISESLPPTSKILFQVHDEIVIETPESDFKKIAVSVKNIMENIVKLSIPLSVDINVGYDLLTPFFKM